MRFTKFLTLVVTIAGLAATGATAGGPGKLEHAAKACKGKAKVMVVLRGAFVAAAADGMSFQLSADHSNRHGRPYLKLAQPLTVNVDEKTRYKKAGADVKLADLAANDRLVVKSKASRCDLRRVKEGDVVALIARKVLAQAPKTGDEGTESEGPIS
jgi:hypothetical protein